MTIDPTVQPNQEWRLETPGHAGWPRTARAGDPDKFFMVSADNHAKEPKDFLQRYIEPEYLERIPHVIENDDGSKYLITEGTRPQLLRPPRAVVEASERSARANGAGYRQRLEDDDVARNQAGTTIAGRDADNARDGIDAEIVFPNQGLLCFATPDPVFGTAMCRAWNRWARDMFSPAFDRMMPAACIVPGDLEGSLGEVKWAAEHGFKALMIANRPVFGRTDHDALRYNDPCFEPLWSLAEEAGLVVCLHVSTGRDPRVVGGPGAAIVNYVTHSMETTIEPLVEIIASGVFERYPKLAVGTVESGIGWLAWLLEAMDHARHAHHMWVKPKLPELPSTYFREHCFATFQVDRVGMDFVVEQDLVDNVMWANDYPHHEGTWPHSAAAIERTMGALSDEQRAKVLGGNAARVFGIEPPAARG